jgi:hypothetical protein
MGVKWARGIENSPLTFLDYFDADPIPFGMRGARSHKMSPHVFRLLCPRLPYLLRQRDGEL